MATKMKVSGGLAFIQTAAEAMPRTLGDRERIFGMCDIMEKAIRLRFPFDKNDGAELRRLGIQTSVGVFRPLDYYSKAVVAGGTYARMWETYYSQKPWKASRAVIQRPSYGHHGRDLEVMNNHRIAVGLQLLLPASKDDEDTGLVMYQGFQVWHCTSMSNDTITICRYRSSDYMTSLRSRDWEFSRPSRHPAKRMTLTREEWAKLNPKISSEMKEAA
ncbi:orotidine 5'-phosphate decarboxylase [Novimethylophilus kurashikiensis]|uniref:Orotidine 5'-phosphate decarboxylase n=1 Tax=Novimethylophilus kurashikiensis TaxID=1825523 RepID=A0A2R5F8M2_9PROT|nr:hypothetical protein [Novimethylophilus kurashikiensis]GBG14547.1 orotidine 5'-phosphate decarboxylase [Novimethylophilus kurashikiensis]